MNKVVITGSKGLIGWHVHARMHALNCAPAFRGENKLFDIIPLDHIGFDDDEKLRDALVGASAILHFAGINRAPEKELEVVNAAISKRLVQACRAVKVNPHIVYANSTHSSKDTPYGRSKRIAGELLSKEFCKYTDLILPHIFGEFARPNYNNVTATFVDAVISGKKPVINPDGCVDLLYVGNAAQLAIDSVINGQYGQISPEGRNISVSSLFDLILQFHSGYQQNIFPSFESSFIVNLFNTYRSSLYPMEFPRTLDLKSDYRGVLFEAVKGGGGGQSFMSVTFPDIVRGNHFHLNKIERFLVVQGEAIIRIRRILSDKVEEFRVSGNTPSFVDIPSFHTHSIQNVGQGDLLTLFWTHELFDPANPDTFADEVLP